MIQELLFKLQIWCLSRNLLKQIEINITAEIKGAKQQKRFDSECNNLKHEVRKLGRYKGKAPKNNLIRGKDHEKLGQYKIMCNSKNISWRENFERLENCTEQVRTNAGTKITGNIWFNQQTQW